MYDPTFFATPLAASMAPPTEDMASAGFLTPFPLAALATALIAVAASLVLLPTEADPLMIAPVAANGLVIDVTLPGELELISSYCSSWGYTSTSKELDTLTKVVTTASSV